jgi:glyoxylase-like metal-dependent hydrolase (beta-lactamase superfamily II)
MIRVLRVLAPNPGPFTLEGTNTWIVGEDPSVVIDPGPDDAGHLLAVIDEAEPVAAVLLTHRHPDHAPGAARLAATARAPVYAFRPEDGEWPLRDGHVVDDGAVAVRTVHTPGHTPDHVAFLIEEEAMMFTGDAVLGRGTSIIDPPEGDMSAYVRSLRGMLALEPRTIYPGHGPVVFDAPAHLEEYLAHRMEREGQVMEALTAGGATPRDIVPRVYGDEVPPSMYAAAERSVLAHLLKLEREERVARAGGPREDRFTLATPKPCQRCGRPARPGSRYCRRCGLAALQEEPARASPGGEQPPPPAPSAAVGEAARRARQKGASAPGEAE